MVYNIQIYKNIQKMDIHRNIKICNIICIFFIWMRGFVLPRQKSEGVLTEGGGCLKGFCPTLETSILLSKPWNSM